jgi:hypothetical protein
MKVYLVVMDYNGDGSLYPEGVFLKKENAEAFCDELNGEDNEGLAKVIKMVVADAED